MNPLYPHLKATADDMLYRFGMRVTVVREEPGRYDPATGRREAGTVRQWQTDAVQSSISAEFMQAEGAGGTAIRSGDMMLVAACPMLPDGANTVPAVGDRVLFPNGRAWTIVRDMPVEPAGGTLLYKGIIRA